MPYSTVSFRMTLSDLEWLSNIFNDLKRRAVSLQQLSFLLSVVSCSLTFSKSWIHGGDPVWIVSSIAFTVVVTGVAAAAGGVTARQRLLNWQSQLIRLNYSSAGQSTPRRRWSVQRLQNSGTAAYSEVRRSLVLFECCQRPDPTIDDTVQSLVFLHYTLSAAAAADAHLSHLTDQRTHLA